MVNISPIASPQVAEIGAKGTSKISKQLETLGTKKMTDWERAQERFDGAMTAATRSKDELQEALKRQTLLGNTDFIKGVNDFLARNQAIKKFSE